MLALREHIRRADLCWIVRHDHRTMERVFWRVPEQREWDIPRHRSDRRSLPVVREISSVDVNGIGLAFAVAGDTGLPPIVLLHALGEDSNTWSTVVEALTLRYRTYAVDLRGHGGSSQPGDYSLELMRSDVLGFLHTLNLDEVTVIRHSLGGAVAYLVAEAEPGLVRQLVLEEPPPLPATPPRVVQQTRMAAGMAREQSAGALCAVLVEEGSATGKVLGSLGLLVMSIIHGVKEKTGPLPPPKGRGIIGCPRAAAQSGRRLRCDTRRIVQTLQD